MTGHILAALIPALPVICLPCLAPAHSADQYFTVAPAEVSIDNLSPGETAEFQLTIQNQDEAPHTFVLTTYSPPEEDTREGRAEFPDDSWVSFSLQETEVAANSEAAVTVTVTVPPEQEWAEKVWEIWLGVEAESDDLLTAKLYVRLLVSTSAEDAGNSGAGLAVGIALAAIAVGYGAHYWRRRAGLR